MIREGHFEDLDSIAVLVDKAKKKMLAEGNDQWDETYPTRKHYESDLHNGRHDVRGRLEPFIIKVC